MFFPVLPNNPWWSPSLPKLAPTSTTVKATAASIFIFFML